MKSTSKNMKCTWPTPEFCVGTQCNLYFTGLRLGFASGKTQILGLASGVTPIQRFTLAPTQNSGVRGIAQRQPPMPGILLRSGI